MQQHPLTITEILRYAVAVHGDRTVTTATGDGFRHATYREVGARAARLANALRRLGIDGDQRVATFMWNNQEHLEAYIAVPSMGAVLHTLNIRLFPEQIEFVAYEAEDQVVIADVSLVPVLAPVLPKLETVHTVIAVGAGDLAPLEANLPSDDHGLDIPAILEKTRRAIRDLPGFEGGVLDQAANLGGLVDPGVSWEDVKRLRDRWPRKLIIKGILHREDAEMAAAVGADGLIVSNHGGRELDGAPSSISALPEIVAAVGHKIEVLMDGGVRRGTHVVKALALGARGVLLGRAYAYGLAAAGERGVSSVIDMLATEIDVTLSLMGVTRAAELATRREQLIRYRPAASASSGEVR